MTQSPAKKTLEKFSHFEVHIDLLYRHHSLEVSAAQMTHQHIVSLYKFTVVCSLEFTRERGGGGDGS